MDKNTKFAKSLDLDFPILCDPSKETALAYGVVNLIRPFPQRWTFIIGQDNKILVIDKKVDPSRHGKDLAAKLKGLGVAKKTEKKTDTHPNKIEQP